MEVSVPQWMFVSKNILILFLVLFMNLIFLFSFVLVLSLKILEHFLSSHCSTLSVAESGNDNASDRKKC